MSDLMDGQYSRADYNGARTVYVGSKKWCKILINYEGLNGSFYTHCLKIKMLTQFHPF